MIRMHTSRHCPAGLLALTLALGVSLPACGGEDELQQTNQRGMGNNTKPITNAPAGGGAGAGTRRSANPPAGGEPTPDGEPEFERPKRADLSSENFSNRARDPFHNYLAAEVAEAPVPVEVVRKERDVKLSEYTFEELKLIAIVNAGRSVAPRALFLSSDNKSKSVKQGEYFSSAEVLLASVNRDYIEVEVVDPELTPGWNLERGERKVIYLKKNE